MKKDLKLYDVHKISNVQELLLKSADKHGGKIAFEDLNNTPIPKLTYSELLSNVLKLGNALRQLGIEERTHIALIGENRVQWALSYFTLMMFNYVVVPIDKNLSQNEIYNVIYESDAETVIFSESYSSAFIGNNSVLKNIKHFICMDSSCGDSKYLSMKHMIDSHDKLPKAELPEINSNDLAEINFTSGSLGRAKGVKLSQGNIAANIVAMVSMLLITPDDRFLSVLPIHHTYECTCGMLCPIYSGASVHFARNLKTIVDDLQKVKATLFLGVPLLYDKMYKKISKSISEDKVKSMLVPALAKATDLTSKLGLKNLKRKVFAELHEKFGGAIRVFIAGGAAPDPLVAKGLRQFGFNFVQGYGLTETSPILALNRLDAFKDDAAGIPLPNVEIKINNPDETGIGEIWAKGPSIMLGYYNNEEATKETFEGDWFKTGDLGYFDDEGFLYISGRKKNVIISKTGKNVFPEEIEDLLNRSPYILESLVYGKKDEKQSEIISAKIVSDSETFIEYAESNKIEITVELINKIITEEIEKINKELPIYKRVVNFGIQDEELQKTTTHKIKRYANNV